MQNIEESDLLNFSEFPHEENIKFTFTPRTLRVYIGLFPEQRSGRVKEMMRKAGYIQKSGWEVLDSEGVPREVLELRIHGATLCIRLEELSETIAGGLTASVERIRQNWMQYLEGTAGTARVSRSGRALNIELVNGDMFTVALESLRAVLSMEERYATVVEIPARTIQDAARNHHITEYYGLFSPRFQSRPAGGEMTA